MDRIWQRQYPHDMPKEIDADAYESLLAVFDRSVGKYADSPAFSQAGATLSFADVDRSARHLAAYLQQVVGIKRGDCVAIMLPNILQFPLSVLAVMRTGAMITNINPLYKGNELAHQLHDAGATTIIAFESCLGEIEKALQQTPVKLVIRTGVADLLSDAIEITPMKPARSVDSVHFNTALNEGASLTLDPVAVASADIAFLQYTGGTTGRSKGAILTHRNLVANLLQASAALGPELKEGQETIVTALPLYHIFALTINCFVFVLKGGHNVLITDPRNLDGFVSELAKWSFTAITGVNTLFNHLLNHAEFRNLDFSALKFVMGGGAAIQASVAGAWLELTGLPILQGYGLSETSPLLTVMPYHVEEFTGSIGVPVPSTDISLRDDEGREIALGEAGELCAKGPQVTQGYWRQDEANRAAFTEDGYFRTGDIAVVDDRGFFFIIDRKKDLIIVSGFNVYPNEIEEVVAQCEGVLECACIGVKDDDSGEAVKVFVVPKAGIELDVGVIRQFCQSRLTAYKVPKEIVRMDSLPKSTVGKILRRKLRDEYG